MQIRLLTVFLTAALAAGCVAANVEQEQAALMALDKEWAATKDIDRFMSYYAADATLHVPGMPQAKGTEAIRAQMGFILALPGFSLQVSPAKAEVSGEVGYTSGTYTATVTNAAGNPETEAGKYVIVWKKQADGQWKGSEYIWNADTSPMPSSPHVMVAAGTLKWGDAPPSLQPGAKMAVVSGDPSMPGPFTIRAQLPAGYRIAPHWHPGDEHVTVLSGTIAMGMGETFDQAALKDLPPGGYAALPATMRHYLLSKTASTIQVHGMGPLVINYVNPADDPSKK